MLIFIFPKYFEYKNFIDNIKNYNKEKDDLKVHIMFNHPFKYANTYFYYIKQDAKRMCFICKIIDDSDVIFALELNSFITEMKSTISKNFELFSFVLFGSAGKKYR
jgi:hypothetical protein